MAYQIKLMIRDGSLKTEEDMRMLVHDVKRIAGLNKRDPLRYSFITEETGLKNAYILFNADPRNMLIVEEDLDRELGNYIEEIRNPRGRLVQEEDTGEDFD